MSVSRRQWELCGLHCLPCLYMVDALCYIIHLVALCVMVTSVLVCMLGTPHMYKNKKSFGKNLEHMFFKL